MSVSLTINGNVYSFPQDLEEDWGTNVTNWASAVTNGMLQKAGGSFTLTAEVDLGANHSFKAVYFKSRTTNPAAAGFIRLAKTDSISWRNDANTADNTLTADGDVLKYNGNPITTLALGAADTVLVMNSGGTAQQYAKITNANVDAAAAIAYSKLNLATSIVNADISNSAAIAYAKLALSNSITNSDIASAAAIAYSKLNLTGSIVNADISNSAAIAYSKLALATSIVNADISGSAAIDWSKISKSGSNLTDIATRNHSDLTGAGTNTHAQIDSHIAATAAHGVSGAVVGTTDAQVLTNKDIDGGTASNTNRVTIPKNTKSNLDGLTRKEATVVYSTDLQRFFGDNGSTLTELGSGGSSGLFNYVQNPGASTDATTGTAVTGTFSRSRGTTESTFSDSYFIIQTGTTEAGTHDWSLDTLQGKHNGARMLLSLRVKVPTTTGTYKVGLYNSTDAAYVTDTELTLTSEALTEWKALFTLDASKTYVVRFERTAGTTDETFYFDDIQVTTEQVVVGSGDEPPQAVSSSLFAGFGTSPTIKAFHHRTRGQWLHLYGTVLLGAAPSGEFEVTLPNGLHADTALMKRSPAAASDTSYWAIEGDVRYFDDSGSPDTVFIGMAALDSTSTTTVVFTASHSSLSESIWGAAANAPVTPASSDVIHFDVMIPIAEWSGVNQVFVNPLVEHAASTNGTWDAAATAANTVFGEGGAPISGALTANRAKVVEFQTSGGRPVLELYGNGQWLPLVEWGYQFQRQGTVTYGARVEPVSGSPKQWTVEFQQYRNPNTSASYGSTGSAWSGVVHTAWRLVKARPGAVGVRTVSSTEPGVVNPPGIWTPVYNSSGAANISGTPSGAESHYIQVGPMVFFTARVSIQSTANDASTLAAFSLPVASTFTATSDLQATVTCFASAATVSLTALADADTTNASHMRVRMRGSNTTTNTTYVVSGSYRVR